MGGTAGGGLSVATGSLLDVELVGLVLGCSMQRTISNILQSMKSVFRGGEILSSRHGCIKHVTPVISARVEEERL